MQGPRASWQRVSMWCRRWCRWLVWAKGMRRTYTACEPGSEGRLAQEVIEDVGECRALSSGTHKVARVVAALGGVGVDFRHVEGFSAAADSSRGRLVTERGFAMRVDGIGRVAVGRSIGRRRGRFRDRKKATAPRFDACLVVCLVWSWSAKRADVWTQRRGRAGVRWTRVARLCNSDERLSQPPRRCAGRGDGAFLVSSP
jgi:hypothetical protein